MTESDISRATRRSIKMSLPLGDIMASGTDNPITIHSVDDEVFAGMWSFIAETMVVTGDLTRATKEAIAVLVSERNKCPVCIKAHSMMGIVATKVEVRQASKKRGAQHNEEVNNQRCHEQALQYAKFLIDKVNLRQSMGNVLTTSSAQPVSPCTKDRGFSDLKESAKAEVALVVALFLHVNRVVSAIMGEEMSTAMMRVPRAAARVMERKGAVKAMSRMMSPLLAGTFKASHESGFTECLFPKQKGGIDKIKLPVGLQNLVLAGHERAKAMSRLVQWVARYESDLLLEGDMFDYDVIRYIESVTVNF